MVQKDKDYELLLIAVLLAGLALGAAGGFVFGWLWKEGPTSSEATKLVDVFIAIGTVGSAVLALLFGLGQKIKEDKTRRLKKQIVLGELSARIRSASQGTQLLCDAYLMIDPQHKDEDIKKVLHRIEGHLQNIIGLFDDAFLESFGEVYEDLANQLITKLSTIKLLRVEFGVFTSECHINKVAAKEKAKENRQRVARFSEMLTHLAHLLEKSKK